eukprot:g12620.t1
MWLLMGESTQEILLVCLVGVLCSRNGGGVSTQAFVSTAGKAAGPACRPEGGRALRCLPRSAARQASKGLFPSVARTPLPPGEGVYEGEKNVEKDKKEESDFNRGVGKVISTLRADYPIIFDEPMDFDIYTPDLQLRDPSGVVLTGLPAYKRMFATFRFARKTLVHDLSTVFRISYDGSRQQVRVTWHFVLDATPMVARPIHVDGVSVYSLSTEGLVRRHDVETIIVNGTPVKPPFAQAWMQLPPWVTQGLSGGAAGAPGAPGLTTSSGIVGGGGGGSRRRSINGGRLRLPVMPSGYEGTALAFQGLATVAGRRRWDGGVASSGVGSESVLAAAERATSFGLGLRFSSSDSSGTRGGVWRASSEKAGGEGTSSRSREGGEGEAEGRSDSKDEESGGTGTRTHSGRGNETKNRKKKKKKLWPIEYDGPLACETSFDCTGGYVCCDLLVVKICCSNGVMQRKPGDLIPSLIPIPGRGRNENDNPPKRTPRGDAR